MQLLQAQIKPGMLEDTKRDRLNQELKEVQAQAEMYRLQINRMWPEHEHVNSMLQQIKTLEKQNIALTQALEQYQGVYENTDTLGKATRQ
jgi:vacuolar-type H+-ATPase subunit I/STV1